MDRSKQATLVYDKIAKEYDKKFSKPSEYIDDFLDLIPDGGKILDIGCGTGVDSGYMKLKGFDVIGIDLSEGMLEIANKKFPQVDFKLMDMRKLDFDHNSFDGVLSSLSLIHIPKKSVLAVLKTIYKLLRKDGVFQIGLQSGKSKEIFIDEPFKPGEKIFFNIISFEEMKKLLNETGFSIIKKYEREPKSNDQFNFTKLVIISKKIG